MWTIAIGDIHGHAAKLSALLRVIQRWGAEHAATKETQLVFLGDYIDRGPQSAEVLQKVRELQAAGAVCLRGNHEDLMIKSVESKLDRQNFLINGGGETCRSLGTVEAFAEAREWMLGLPLFHVDAVRYFVHAGVRPRLPLNEQSPKDQMWIRDVFLSHEEPFERYIVHGHTPSQDWS
jgi:serine/threonine protein phosphatase 1